MGFRWLYITVIDGEACSNCANKYNDSPNTSWCAIITFSSMTNEFQVCLLLGFYNFWFQIAEDYSHCEFLLRLPGYCPSKLFEMPFCLVSFNFLTLHSIFVDMEIKSVNMYPLVPAFRDVIDVPLVVRRIHKSRSEVWTSQLGFYFLGSILPHFVVNLWTFASSGEERTWNWR